MNRVFVRLWSIILASLIIFGMAFPAYANEVDSQSAESEILGTDDNITGYLLPDEETQSVKGRAITFPVHFGDGIGDSKVEIFSITAVKVYDLLASKKGDKSFKVSSLPSTANTIVCVATLNHSLHDPNENMWMGDYTVAGICQYDYSTLYQDYVYDSVYSFSMTDQGIGTTVQEEFEIEGTLEDDITYYSFVKNTYPAGYVYGTLKIYWK